MESDIRRMKRRTQEAPPRRAVCSVRQAGKLYVFMLRRHKLCCVLPADFSQGPRRVTIQLYRGIAFVILVSGVLGCIPLSSVQSLFCNGLYGQILNIKSSGPSSVHSKVLGKVLFTGVYASLWTLICTPIGGIG